MSAVKVFSLNIVRSLQVLAVVLAIVMVWSLMPAQSQASGLTQAQITAILNVLQAFGADQSIINNVAANLYGTTPPPSTSSITVTAPNGGQAWEIGALNTITWSPYSYIPTTVNGTNDVSVYLERLDGTRVGRIMDQGKASLHTYFNIDSYDNWAVPGQYYVRAVNNVTGANDRSDAPFTLLPRAVNIQVNGSEGPVTLADNQQVTVSYTTTGALSACYLNGLRIVPGAQPTSIQIGTAAVGGSITGYAYAPVPGSSTSVYAICYKSDGTTRSDGVQVNMNGTPASLQVTSPNGGEQVVLGQYTPVTFNTSGVRAYSIALYKNDQWMRWLAKDQTLNSFGSNYVSYTWWPSAADLGAVNELGSVFKIYVTAQKADGTGYVDDKSDNTFSFLSTNTSTNTGTPSFTASPNNGTAPLTTTFTLNNVTLQGSEMIDFGDGIRVPLSTTMPSVAVHQYTASGTYTASLLRGSSVFGYASVIVSAAPATTTTCSPVPAIDCASGYFPVSGGYAQNGCKLADKCVAVGGGVAEVRAIGVYQGTGGASTFCYSKPGTVTVTVPPNKAPIILSLSSYEPVKWVLKVDPSTTIQKIILSGYHPQTVSGQLSGTPVENHFYHNYARYTQGSATYSNSTGDFYNDQAYPGTVYDWAGDATCAATSGAIANAHRRYFTPSSDFFFAYVSGSAEYTTLAAKLTSLTGLPVKSFQAAETGSTFTLITTVSQSSSVGTTIVRAVNLLGGGLAAVADAYSNLLFGSPRSTSTGVQRPLPPRDSKKSFEIKNNLGSSTIRQEVKQIRAEIKDVRSEAKEKIQNIKTEFPGASACGFLQRSLGRGSRGDDVSQLQNLLQQTGDLNASSTGFFGTATERALQLWQARTGLVLSGNASTTGFGTLGPKTRNALMMRCKELIQKKQGHMGTTTTPIGNVGTTTPTCVLTADKQTIALGESVVLTWTSQNAVEASAIGGGRGPAQGSVTLSPAQTTNYLKRVYSPAGTGQCITTVTVGSTTPSAEQKLVLGSSNQNIIERTFAVVGSGMAAVADGYLSLFGLALK